MSLSADVRARRVALAVMVGSVLVLAGTGVVGWTPALAKKLGWSPAATASYVRGEIIDVPRAVFERDEHTLVVFASSTCGACVRSRGAFRAVASDLRGSATRLVLLTPASMRSCQQAFAGARGLEANEHLAIDLSKLRVRSLPTVVLVDRTGRVLYAKEGLIDSEGQAAIQQAIASARS